MIYAPLPAPLAINVQYTGLKVIYYQGSYTHIHSLYNTLYICAAYVA